MVQQFSPGIGLEIDRPALKIKRTQSASAIAITGEGNCANCGLVLRGPFCSECGQNAEATARPVRELLNHALEAFFDFDGRGLHTLRLLLLRPGRLTEFYLAGRRESFVPPLRLYLFVSLMFFFVVWQTGTAIVQFAHAGQAGGVGVLALKMFAPLESTPRPLPAEAIQFDNGDGDAPAWVERGIESVRRAFAEPATLNERLYRLFPKMMFGMVPFFALVLWALLAGAGRYLIEHIVFSLHYHSFLFILGTVLIILRPLLPAASVDLLFAVPAVSYLLVAMHLVYRQRWLATVIKAIVLLVVYYVIFGIGLLGIIAAGLSAI